MAGMEQTRDQLKGTGSVILAELATDRFTRTLAGDGLARVNPFEVQKGNAPSEEAAPHDLNDWDGYDHDRIESGNGLSVVVGYREATLSWSRHAGYNNSLCRQLAYAKSMGASEDLSVNPFSSPDDTDDAADGTSHTMTGLTPGHFYAFGLKAEFHDSDAAILPGDSTACDPAGGATALLGAGEGISSGVAIYDDTPSIDSVIQTTDPNSCFVGENVNLRLNVTMEGPSTGRLEQRVNGGSSWTLVDSSVSAGTSTINLSRQSGNNYEFRLRYNDVSPDQWDTSSSVSATCNLL